MVDVNSKLEKVSDNIDKANSAEEKCKACTEALNNLDAKPIVDFGAKAAELSAVYETVHMKSAIQRDLERLSSLAEVSFRLVLQQMAQGYVGCMRTCSPDWSGMTPGEAFKQQCKTAMTELENFLATFSKIGDSFYTLEWLKPAEDKLKYRAFVESCQQALTLRIEHLRSLNN